MSDDFEVLHGFFFSSRYISRSVYAKYGLDVSLYDTISPKSIKTLKGRLQEWIMDPTFVPPVSGSGFREALGENFGWVRSSLDIFDDEHATRAGEYP